jgi:hypothetical protein
VEEYFIPETKLWNKVSGYFTTEFLTRVCMENPQTEYSRAIANANPKPE